MSVIGVIGADTTTPIDVTATASTTTGSTSQTSPAVTTTGDARLVLRLDSLNAAVTSTPAAGDTEEVDITAGTISQHADSQIYPTAGSVPATTSKVAFNTAAGHHTTLAITLTAATTRYTYTGPSDAASIVTDGIGTTIDKNIGLPGGVQYTQRTDGNRWSYPNIHGDIIASADTSGTKIGLTAIYDPDGNTTNALRPDVLTGDFDTSYLGQYGKLQEPSANPYLQGNGIIQMGARLYHP